MGLTSSVFDVLWRAALDEIEQQLHLFRMATLQHNKDASILALHAIRGVAGNFMMKSLCRKAGKTEILLRTDKSCNPQTIISELEKTLNKTY